MDAYEITHVETQNAVNLLYAVVFTILPFLLFGDCRKTMSLFFKRIRSPMLDDILQEPIEVSTTFQIVIITIAVIAYYAHRIWRKKLLNLRCHILELENELTDGKDINELKIKLLEKVDNVIKERTNSEEHLDIFEDVNVISQETSTIEKSGNADTLDDVEYFLDEDT